MADNRILITIADQRLNFFRNATLTFSCLISSSIYGVGNEKNSNRTPLGLHRISELIGLDQPLGMLFKSRLATGLIGEINPEPFWRESDLISSRIIRLQGVEEQNGNSFERYIYIHGTCEEGLIGQRASHGCIRMRNKDIVELCKLIDSDTLVEIRIA